MGAVVVSAAVPGPGGPAAQPHPAVGPAPEPHQCAAAAPAAPLLAESLNNKLLINVK